MQYVFRRSSRVIRSWGEAGCLCNEPAWGCMRLVRQLIQYLYYLAKMVGLCVADMALMTG